MTVSARFRVKRVPAGLVDLMVFNVLNVLVVEEQKKVKLLIYYFFLIYYTKFTPINSLQKLSWYS